MAHVVGAAVGKHEALAGGTGQEKSNVPELVVALLTSLVRTMLMAFVEVIAEERASRE
jgi:hypothetical protein